MGPVHKPKSTRAQRGRSVPTSPKSRRKPVPSKRSKFRTAADVLRDAERIRGSRFAERLRIKPRPGPPEMAARLSKRKRATGLGTAAIDALREQRDGVPASALRDMRNRLELIQSSAIVVAHALMEQNAEVDDDAARVLTRHVGDALTDQIESINRMLGEEGVEDEDETGGVSCAREGE